MISQVNHLKSRLQKKGIIEIRGNKKILVLEEGETINEINGRISKFKF